MRFSTAFFIALIALSANKVDAQVVGGIEVGVPEKPEVIIIYGEGTIVDPNQWTEFPTPPPAVTDPPTPYPTPLSPAPTLQNYILIDGGAAVNCGALGMNAIANHLCLDAITLIAQNENFPFYVEAVATNNTKPCGCYLHTKENGGKMVEFNHCGPHPQMSNFGYGKCVDVSTGDWPEIYGETSSRTACESTCLKLDSCVAYTWEGSIDICTIHFNSMEARDENYDTVASTMNQPVGVRPGCNGGPCGTQTGVAPLGIAARVYVDDNFAGQSAEYGYGNYDLSSLPCNDCITSMRVYSGFRVVVYKDAGFAGETVYLNPGDYTRATLEGLNVPNDWISSLRVQHYQQKTCYEKTYFNPTGSANANSQLACELATPIDGGNVEDDDARWSKLYGSGSLAELKYATWPDHLTSTPIYIRRKCPDCAASHQSIVYKRLTPFPYGYDVDGLFLSTWTSTNNAFNTDFELYSTMSYAQAGLMKWTYCNFNDSGIGFPRDCGPNGQLGGEWNSLTRGGPTNYEFEIYIPPSHATVSSGDNDSGNCVGSDITACGCGNVNQGDYRGTISTTRSGKTCQAWSSQTPHPHDYLVSYPGTGIDGGHNYCRNPGSDSGGAWCYTTDPNTPWEYCNVPMCTYDGILSDWWNHFPYNGHISAAPTPATTEAVPVMLSNDCNPSTFGAASGSWVLCGNYGTSAWLSGNPGGTYNALAICQSMGFTTVTHQGGTCGTVCGYCDSSTCENPATYDLSLFTGGGGSIESMGNTVMWRCA